MNIKALRIVSAERLPPSNGAGWLLYHDVTTDTGIERHAHAFPESTFEWRAAEYELDPADMQTLLDIVIHEPHLPEGWDSGPDFLHRAPDRAAARVAHLARIAACKKALGTNSTLPKVHDPANTHPLHGLAASVVVDPVKVAAKHLAVGVIRGEPAALAAVAAAGRGIDRPAPPRSSNG